MFNQIVIDTRLITLSLKDAFAQPVLKKKPYRQKSTKLRS